MIDISLFGTTTLHEDNRPIDVHGIKPRRILGILAADLGNPVTKDVLAEGLWDGRPPASYVASVESYVCVLRRSLAAGGRPVLVTAHGGYLLDPAHVRVDLVDVRSDLQELTSAHGEPLVAGAEAVLARISRRLLVDEPFAAWADGARARLDDLVEVALTRAAESALEAGQPSRALRLAGAVLDRRRLSERACRTVMEAHRMLGARAQSLEVYADLRSMMIDELGVEPCERTRALYLTILDDVGQSRPRERDRAEVSALVRLLRETFESGVRPDSATRSWLNDLRFAEAGRTA
jgi:DNA-binding SARP family transcriptional activator